MEEEIKKVAVFRVKNRLLSTAHYLKGFKK